jgi:GNAT superfamily N-acetyltransferase
MTTPSTEEIGPANPVFLIRPGYPLDHSLIVDSWIESDKNSERARSAGRCYMREQKRVIRDILAKTTIVTLVAVVPDEQDAIFGWTVVDLSSNVIHYVYVKKSARKMGIAKALLHDFIHKDCEYPYKPVFEELTPKIPDNWSFNPYRAW